MRLKTLTLTHARCKTKSSCSSFQQFSLRNALQHLVRIHHDKPDIQAASFPKLTLQTDLHNHLKILRTHQPRPPASGHAISFDVSSFSLAFLSMHRVPPRVSVLNVPVTTPRWKVPAFAFFAVVCKYMQVSVWRGSDLREALSSLQRT